jgi:hypothetical protein
MGSVRVSLLRQPLSVERPLDGFYGKPKVKFEIDETWTRDSKRLLLPLICNSGGEMQMHHEVLA